VLSAIFTYAIGKGDFPARSDEDNPAHRALIPESATEPGSPVAASAEEAKAILEALKKDSLARAAVALVTFTRMRPGETLGCRWEDWNREAEQLFVARGLWHGELKST